MAVDILYSKDSICNLDIDVVDNSTGTFTKVGSGLKLDKNSSCGYKYTFNKTSDAGKTLRCDYIKFDCVVNAPSIDMSTRYNNNVVVELGMQLYKYIIDVNGNVVDIVDGEFKRFTIYPYLFHEKDGYITTLAIPIDDRQIKNITLKLYYNDGLDDNITFKSVKLFASIKPEEAIEDNITDKFNDVAGASNVEGFIMFRNTSNFAKLEAVGVVFTGAPRPPIIKPIINNGVLEGFETNFGRSYYNINTTDAPDMTPI